MTDPHAALGRALDAADLSRHDDARRELRAAIDAAGAPDVPLLAARVLFLLRDYQAALDVLEAAAATAVRADRVAAHDLAHELAGRLGWYRDALAASTKALALEPTAARHMRAAKLAFSAQNPAVGVAHVRAAIALEPSSASLRMEAAARVSGADDELARKLVESAVLLSRPSPELDLRAATLLLEAGAFERAEALLRRAIQREPRAEALASLARVALWRGDVAEALRCAEAALAREPSSPLAHRARGAARVMRGEPAAALPHLDEAIRARPRDGEALVWRAEAKLHLGQPEQALADALAGAETAWDSTDYVAAQAVAHLARRELGLPEDWPPFGLPEAMRVICPDDPRNLALALERMRGNRGPTPTYVPHDDTRPRLLHVRRNPRDPSKRAVFLVATSGPAAALRAFERIHADYPDRSEPYCYHGEVHLYLGEYAEARRNFLKALEIYERTRWAYIGLGATELFEGDARRALDTFRRGVAICGTPGPTMYAYRGEAHRVVGNLAAAREDLARSVEQAPSRIGASVNLALVAGAEGDRDEERAIAERLLADAPGLLADASRAIGVASDTREPAATRALLEKLLDMLRGNRSSTCVTYFTDEGRLRAVSPQGRDLPHHEADDRRLLRERLAR